MLRDGTWVLLSRLNKIVSQINKFAKKYSYLPILARTHGQSASPTTFGKEFKVFAARLERQLTLVETQPILCKLNGATGNYNAHVAAYPDTDWKQFTKRFIGSFNKAGLLPLKANLITTQIEPHDSYVALFDCFRRINSVLIDFNQDIWRYISDQWIIQKSAKDTIGSSTMPHKVNPIKFENSEGNLGMANANFEFFARKLPVSRLQRDLSDSTVERNFGVAFAHSLIAYEYLLEGLDQIHINEFEVRAVLREHPEVIAEAIQTILRREGVNMPYETLKTLTRGRKVTSKDLQKFIDKLQVSNKIKQELKKISPENYTGLAPKLSLLKSDH